MQSKITLIENPVKKARGRPRTVPVEELPIPKLTRSTNEPIPAAVIAAVEAEKKKRGRPRNRSNRRTATAPSSNNREEEERAP